MGEEYLSSLPVLDSSLITTIAFVAVLVSLIITIFIIIGETGKLYSTRSKPLNLPPGSYGWPILGETLEFLGAGVDGIPEKYIKERMEKYQSPEVFKTSLMGEPVAVLCSPAGNKFLFSNENKLVTIWWPNSVRKLLGPCLATTSGDEGKQMRKMLSCFITPDAFTRLYIKTMDVVAQQHINTHWLGKEELKVFPIIKLYTFELACRLFMSLENPQQIAKLAALFNVFLKGIISVPLNFPGTRFFNAKRATIAIKKQLQTIVRNRRVALEQETASASQDLLSHLLAHPDENGKFMPESVIVNNILMLLFAGHDTSSVAITMLMKNLGQLPQTYEKVFREQRAIASSKEAGEFLQWEDIQKMKYSWNVVSETMRLSPPVIGAFREALVDFKFAGYDIPKGWKLYWSASLAHTDSSLFQENINFDPSRYERAGPIPFSYVPFGGGPRMCLGKEFARLEILIFVHNIVKRFQWDLLIPDEKVEYDPLPTPVKGLPVHLHPHKPLDVVASYVDLHSIS
ncbi:beta-amyrin 28-oxidase-like [Olea europaea subsp. europaea]|uniref:Beta-amyrin 28-oxidase-like n=1 Tax=Olea europaea subsp. europaea TaxID=158383 RepID=A0A8S0P6L5_OLEEU|nr:beta-amyrin 28-oxidase-like [Olea europaea subsp. europaea]